MEKTNNFVTEFVAIGNRSIQITNLLAQVYPKDDTTAAALILLGITLFKDFGVVDEEVDNLIINLRKLKRFHIDRKN